MTETVNLEADAPTTTPETSTADVLRFVTQEFGIVPVATSIPASGWWVVTPKTAAAWMERNTGNFRRLDRKDVGAMRRQMDRGQWSRNPQPVVFLRDGSLADGQHRLAALAGGTAAVVLKVEAGMDPEVVDFLDTGRSRSSADILRRSGMTQVNVSIAVARLVWRRREKDSGGRINPAELAHFASQLPCLDEAVKVGSELYSKQDARLLRQASLAFAAFMCGEEIEPFLGKVTSTEGLVRDTAAYTLVRRQLRLAHGSHRQVRERLQDEAIAILHAFAYHQAGAPMKQLKLPQGAALWNLPGIDFVPQGVSMHRRKA